MDYTNLMDTARQHIGRRCEHCGPFLLDETDNTVYWRCRSLEGARVSTVSADGGDVLLGMLLSTTSPEHPRIHRGLELVDYVAWLNEVFGEQELVVESEWVIYSIADPNPSCLSEIAWSNPDYRDFWHGHSLVVPLSDYDLGAFIWKMNNP